MFVHLSVAVVFLRYFCQVHEGILWETCPVDLLRRKRAKFTQTWHEMAAQRFTVDPVHLGCSWKATVSDSCHMAGVKL